MNLTSQQKCFHFENIASLKVECIELHTDQDLRRTVHAAGQSREYSLIEDWLLNVQNYRVEKLNGVIKIPKGNDGKQLIFDGASIPMPWIFSAITFGIARPMGVMMTPSIIHDFAYEHGYLFIKSKDHNNFEKVELERHEADDLFCDLMTEITNMPNTSRLGWMVLRTGWFFVDYAGKKRGGRKPHVEIAPLIFGLCAVALFILFAPKFLILLSLAVYAAFWAYFSHGGDIKNSDTKMSSLFNWYKVLREKYF